MRISDWSSDVCSSDLLDHRLMRMKARENRRGRQFRVGDRAEQLFGFTQIDLRLRALAEVRFARNALYAGELDEAFGRLQPQVVANVGDRKSTRLTSSH